MTAPLEGPNTTCSGSSMSAPAPMSHLIDIHGVAEVLGVTPRHYSAAGGRASDPVSEDRPLRAIRPGRAQRVARPAACGTHSFVVLRPYGPPVALVAQARWPGVAQ